MRVRESGLQSGQTDMNFEKSFSGGIGVLLSGMSGRRVMINGGGRGTVGNKQRLKYDRNI